MNGVAHNTGEGAFPFISMALYKQLLKILLDFFLHS